ncbi:hypothetical protein HMPREF1986_01169 [Oribacterium sp. oral taxon 078 str. F0263]|nr:hypothetical protein HMPREF1986_01169 [Oribacterium sp. oral taxon 078 str. F0263]
MSEIAPSFREEYHSCFSTFPITAVPFLASFAVDVHCTGSESRAMIAAVKAG